jgi:group I intron endonuclease
MNKSRGNSRIRNALLKYGYAQFSLDILEYCEPFETISKEQKYLDLLNPEYNICKYAGSTLGKKHSKETIDILKAIIPTEEQRAKHKLAIRNQDPIHRIKRIERLRLIHADPEQKARLLIRVRKFNAYLKQLNSKKVEIVDTLNNKTTEYSSITEAAQAMGCTTSSASEYLINYTKTGVLRLLMGRYFVYYFKDKSKFIFPTPEELDKLKKTEFINLVQHTD